MSGYGSNQTYSLEREGCLNEGLDSQPQQDQGAVVTGSTIQVEDITTGAPVDEHPLPVSSHGDRDRLHGRTAVRVAIARSVVVEVPAPQTVRTMVPVLGTGGMDRHIKPTVPASKRIGATAARAMTLVA